MPDLVGNPEDRFFSQRGLFQLLKNELSLDFPTRMNSNRPASLEYRYSITMLEEIYFQGYE